MHRTRAPHRRVTRALAATVLALGAAACTDRSSPVSPGTKGPEGPPAPSITLQALQCSADRNALTVSCKPATPDGNAQGDIIVGNQHVWVNLTSSNVAYNSGTGQFTFDVTVQNLIEQKMGTLDGSTLAAGGVRVFFHQGPTVTSGTGTASVVPDGFATFTAAGQPYYQYNQVLAQNATSAAHTWTIIFPPTVTTFDFLLYVNAPVQFQTGYVTLDGKLPGDSYGSLHPGDTHALTAVVKNAVGQVQAGSVTWGTSDAGCATVDGSGVVTGVQFNTCTITATSGTRPGGLVFNVTGTVRNWTGAVSSNWDVGGNWAGGLVPATADSVHIPDVATQPQLFSTVTVSNVAVDDVATLDVVGFTLNTTGDVATGSSAPSGIIATGAGQLTLAGTNKLVHGRLPKTFVSGTYSLDGDWEGVAPTTVEGGQITSTSHLMRLTSQ